MAREVQQPTRDERGMEEHPAWALIGASRVQSTGTALFDSDVKHQHYVVVTLRRAVRDRDLHRDRIFTKSRQSVIAEVAMSEAQWASFVSSMNAGDGVPCTIQYEGGELTPGVPFEPRLQESFAEVRDAATKAIGDVREAFEAYKAHKTVGNLRHLQAMIDNMPSNVEFAAKSLSEHAENVVQRAKFDVEAYVTDRARQLGLDPAELGGLPELAAGDGAAVDAEACEDGS